MTTQLQTLFILLALFQVKHLFADFFLQSPRMLSDRGRYLHLGRAQHAGLHAAFSALALLVVGVGTPALLLICAVEWLVHFHIDWAKGRYSEIAAQGPADAGYWRAFGVDQMLHQLTYVAMLWAAAVALG